MLTQLRISNFGIIDKVEINFSNGLTVLTGETGAGKSIIANALNFLFGLRASSDFIKTGATRAEAEGTFYIGEHHFLNELETWLTNNGYEMTDSRHIYISREVNQSASKARINGSIASVAHLLYLKNFLLTIHEQNEHIELLKTDRQLELLDQYGEEKHYSLLISHKNCFKDYIELEEKLTQAVQKSNLALSETERIKFEMNEIETARFQDPGEEEKIIQKRNILLNKKELIENSSLVYEIVSGDNNNNLLSNLSKIKTLLSGLSRYDSSFNTYLEDIEDAIFKIKALSSFISNYCDNTNFNNDNLKELEERLDLIYRLKRKYGKSIEEILEYYKNLRLILEQFSSDSASIDKLKDSLKNKETRLFQLANLLSASRKTLIEKFTNRVNEELNSLGFNQAHFCIECIESELTVSGKDKIQFLFTANLDEPPKPLLKVISGGELSRVVLAIKSIIVVGAGLKPAPTTMIFDEIDLGISGAIANSVAKKLYNISKQNQVICVTHQPIICAMADNHLLVRKSLVSSATKITVDLIKNNNDRVDALAALLTPEKMKEDRVSGDARNFARSLIDNANKIKETKKELSFKY